MDIDLDIIGKEMSRSPSALGKDMECQRINSKGPKAEPCRKPRRTGIQGVLESPEIMV